MTGCLSDARAIIAGTLAAGSDASFTPFTVVVLDAGGHVVAVEREDGASNKRFGVAAVTHSVGALVRVPGDVLAKSADGTLLGAVGVSGDTSDHDKAAALAGIAAAGPVGQAG